MERTIGELNRHFKEPDATPMVLWATVFYRRKATQKVLRNIKPILVNIIRMEDDMRRYSFYGFRLTDADNKWIELSGSAVGSEFHFFDTQREASEYYNSKVDNSINEADKAIAYLTNDKRKLQSLKINQ